MKIASVDYTTFWSLVSSKGLLPQYVDVGNVYNVFAVEDNISWETTIDKDGGTNQTDFETNRQSTCNQQLEYRSTDGLPKIASAMFSDIKSFWVDGTATQADISAGTTSYIKKHF